jgi:hypothetical protein
MRWALRIGLILLIPCFPALFFWFLNWWPPTGVEKPMQRQKLTKRVHEAGGWSAVQRDAEIFPCTIEVPSDSPYLYMVGRTNNAPLPPALAVLKPINIRPLAKVTHQFPEGPQDLYGIRMQIFGRRGTGYFTPYLFVDVILPAHLDLYAAKEGSDTTATKGYSLKVSESIFLRY